MEMKQIKMALGVKFESSGRRKRDGSSPSLNHNRKNIARGGTTRTGTRSTKQPSMHRVPTKYGSKYYPSTRAGAGRGGTAPIRRRISRSRPPTLPSMDATSSSPFDQPGGGDDAGGNDEFRPRATSELRFNFARSRLLPSIG